MLCTGVFFFVDGPGARVMSLRAAGCGPEAAHLGERQWMKRLGRLRARWSSRARCAPLGGKALLNARACTVWNHRPGSHATPALTWAYGDESFVHRATATELRPPPGVSLDRVPMTHTARTQAGFRGR